MKIHSFYEIFVDFFVKLLIILADFLPFFTVNFYPKNAKRKARLPVRQTVRTLQFNTLKKGAVLMKYSATPNIK